MQLKKVYSAIGPYIFSSTDIYRIVNFDSIYSSIPVGFRGISMSFLSQKTHTGNFLRPEVILSRNYIRKCSIWLRPSPIINLLFFKNAIKAELLGVRS